MKRYVIYILLYLCVIFITIWVLDSPTLNKLGKEDGLFEYLTAIYLLVASAFFFLSYKKSKLKYQNIQIKPATNYFYLILAIIFFFGFGEEISWGQRILNVKTPEFLTEINVQKEINIHNIELINLTDKNGKLKPFWIRYLTTIAGLFTLFCLFYCILVPLAFRYLYFCKKWLQKIHFPIVPIEIGFFFLASWIMYYFSIYMLPSKDDEILSSLGEIKECNIAFLFMVIAFYFLKHVSIPITKKERESLLSGVD